MAAKATVGIIGGSGIYEADMFEDIQEFKLHTPYGPPSGAVQVGRFKGLEVAFLPRHGRGHVIPPHKVNYRANIWALRELGVERIVSACAVGSLKEELRPGDVVLPDQFIDFTKGREGTFFDGGRTVHISTADPFCPELRKTFTAECARLGVRHHQVATYITIEGPRFSTRAESRMFRTFADVIGMTLNPEVQLAREKEMCYASLAMVTDYDVWAERPVNLEEVLGTLARNVDTFKKLLGGALPLLGKSRACACGQALRDAEI